MLNKYAAKCLIDVMDISPELAASVSGVSVDSRLVKQGDLFIAFVGDRTDGHDYLKDVAEKKAIAAVVSDAYLGPAFLPLIKVKNPLSFLQNLAKEVLKASQSKIVAITGSVGKTTTKEFIFHLLSQQYVTASSPGNSNSQIGLPLAVLNHTRGDEEIVVLEMGMTHAGQIAKLVEIAPPDIAVITSVGLVHACNFENLDQIALSKAEIFSNRKTNLGIINSSLNTFEGLFRNTCCPIFTYSALVSTADYTMINENATLTLYENNVEKIKFDPLPFTGKHHLENFLAAATVAHHLGMQWHEIADRAKTLKLPQKRSQFVEINGILFIDDSYNAAPLSVKAALESMPLPKIEGGRKIAVLGSMLELGKFSEECHDEIGRYALEDVDLLFCLGVECRPMEKCWNTAKRPVKLFLERSILVEELKKIVMSGDVVLLKGSNASGVWKIIEELKA